MSDIKYLSPGISYYKKESETTLIILPRLTTKQEALLTAWLFCWTICGVFFIWQLFGNYSKEQKLYFVILISFWAYYEYRIGYTWLWKKYGMELFKFDNEAMYYKRSLKKYGKVYKYYYENINNFKADEIKPQTFSSVLENSFWVIGGEKLSFNYLSDRIRVGIQLKSDEIALTERFIKNEIKERKKLSV
jgi:hypothetical protein